MGLGSPGRVFGSDRIYINGGGHVRVSRWLLAAGGGAGVAAAVAVGTALGSAKAPAAPKATFPAAPLSDVGGFNDNGFYKLQLAGLKRAAKKIPGVKAIPLVSHSASDYDPNYTTAVNEGAKIIVAAGFLLEGTVKKFATQYPNIKFAITDDSVKNIGGLPN